jgi:hypothetical protein
LLRQVTQQRHKKCFANGFDTSKPHNGDVTVTGQINHTPVAPLAGPVFQPVAATAGETIQPAVRLSASALWPVMQHFYQTHGPEAFEQIPYFATTNAPMADAYTDCILAYWGTLPANTPLTLIELAAGSGRLGFLLLTRLLEKKAQHPTLADAPFTLVLTDFAESSVASLEQHTHLQGFIQQGILDFAVVNPLCDQDIHLRLAGKPLSAGPWVVMANYLFDSLPQDAYQVNQGQLHHTLLSLTSTEDLPQPVIPTLDQLDLHYTHQPVTDEGVYDDPLLNRILWQTAQAYYNASFLLPVGALRCLSWLDALSGGQWLLLATDKGSQRKENHLVVDTPDMVTHAGAFSFFVNFEALQQWFEAKGGQTLSCPVQLQQPLFTFCAARGLAAQQPDDALPQAMARQFGLTSLTRAVPTLLPILNTLQASHPLDFEADQRQIEALLTCIRLSLCDPFVISRLTRVIYPFLPSFLPAQRDDFLQMLNRAYQLYFPFAAEPLYPLSLGIFLTTLGLHDKALAALRQAMALQPHNAHVYLWLGKTYDQLHNPRKARDCYHNTVVLDASLTDAHDRLAALNVILNERPTESDWFNPGI